ncbi:uncharacterized, partial [Tachysurus ichikawai]
MKCFNCGETGHLVRALIKAKVKTGVTDGNAEQTELTDNSVSGEGETSVAVADPPATEPVALASSILHPVVAVSPAVMDDHSGGDPDATVAKPAGDVAGAIEPAMCEKGMGDMTTDPLFRRRNRRAALMLILEIMRILIMKRKQNQFLKSPTR